MSGYKAECRKFQANIFNKSKCTNCFKQREEHSSDALDSNRVAREGECGGFGPPYSFDGPLAWSPKLKGSPTLLSAYQTCSSIASSPSSKSLLANLSASTGSSSNSSETAVACRKVSKCGYLFVAPDWDFTIPLYRTKRWQRRWFVLYDDGELTYSVDDLPATIPQGVIDMNRVLEVSTAEDVTGNQFSLAITAPDRVTFVKGTCREESRWWQDVLSVLARMHKHGRHKRNATFPGIKGSSSSAVSTASAVTAAQQHNRAGDSGRGVPSTLESPVNQRVRFHSISSDLRGARRPSSAPSLDAHSHIFVTPHKQYGATVAAIGKPAKHYDSVNESSNGSEDDTITTTNVNDSTDTRTADKRTTNKSNYYDDTTKSNNEKNSYYNTSKISRENSYSEAYNVDSYSNSNYGYNNNSSNNNNNSSCGSTITPYSSLHYSRSVPIPTAPSSLSSASPVSAPVNPSSLPHSTPLTSNPLATSSSSSRLIRDEHKENTPPYTPEYRDNPPTSESPPTQDKQTHRLRTRRALNREARALSQPRSELQTSSVLADIEATKREEKLKDIAASITTTSSRRRAHHHHHHTPAHQSSCNVADKPTRDRDADVGDTNDPTDTPPPLQVRGTPDGCGGIDDGGSSSSLQRVDLPAEDLLYIKKGWLLKAGETQDWNKYWFVLHGTGLRFYRNSSAEDTGILDGIIDLGTAKDIHNLDVARNYGFVIKTWSDKKYVFSAVTAGIRNNWVQALRNAANFKTSGTVAVLADTALSDSLLKSATIESVAAERDHSPLNTKNLLAYNNKHNTTPSVLSNKNLTLENTKNNALSSNLNIDCDTVNSNLKQSSNIRSSKGNNDSITDVSVISNSRVPLSSDDEYKTASETSATSNLSNDNTDFFEWDGSRSRNNSGHSNNINNNNNSKRRSQSSPPISRRGTTDSFPNMESSYGLNRNILDRYKNMQNHTKNNVPYSSSSAAPKNTSSFSPSSSSMDVVDYSSKAAEAGQHNGCDALSTCAKLSSLAAAVEKDATSGYGLSDSIRSLDLESSLQHDKVSSSGTLASGSGDALLVDLLETQVETLKAKLEVTQADLLELHKEHVTLHQRATLHPTPPPPSSTSTTSLHHLHQHQSQLVHQQSSDTAATSSQETLFNSSDLEETKQLLSSTQEQLAESQTHLQSAQDLIQQNKVQLLLFKDGTCKYQTQVDQLLKEGLRCEAELGDARKENLRYQTEVQETDKKMCLYHEELEETRKKNIELQGLLEEARNELEETQHHLQESRENMAACIEDSQQLRLQLQDQQQLLDLQQNNNYKNSEHKNNSEESTEINEFQRVSEETEELKQDKELLSSLQCEVEQLVEQVGRKDRQLTEETATLLTLQQKHQCEKASWRGRAERNEQQLQQLTDTHQGTITSLKGSLEASEHRVAVLSAQLEGRNSRTVKESQHASTNTLEALLKENAALARQLSECQSEACQLKDSVKSEKSEVYKWKDLVKELRSLLDGRNSDMDRKREEIRLTRESLRNAQQDHELTKDRLQRGIDENETLSGQLRELQRQLNSQDKRASSTASMYSSREKFSSRRQLPRLDSLSDLSNVDFSIDPDELDKETLTDEYCEVRARLERSISEIRALRRELRESQSAHDALHLTHLQLGQDCSKQRQDADAQLGLMTDRLQDLTNKLANSEKQVRLLKTKMTRAESRDRRRSHSLKGKDTLGLGRDVDQKLSQLEAKIEQLMPTIETGAEEGSTSTTLGEESRPCDELSGTSTPTRAGGAVSGTSTPTRTLKQHTRRSKSFDDPSKAGRLRRKSLESSANTDGVNAALRINNIEAKVAALAPARSRSPTQAASPAGSPLRSPPMTRHSKTRSSSERSSSKGRRAAEASRAASDLLPPADTLSLLCAQLCECVEWLDSYRCCCGSSANLSSLHQRLSSAYQLAAGTSQLAPASISPLADRLQPVAQQMVQLLQQKFSSLAERRQNLKATNSWTKEAQLKNFAERIAYETVLLSQVSQALRVCNQSNSNLDSVKLQDLMESHRKIAFLEKKLTNPEFDLDLMAPLEFYTSMLAEKLVLTGDIMSSMNNSNNKKLPDPRLEATCRDLQGRLLERERQLARLVTSYKEEKLHEVAVVMAQELSNSTPQDDSVLMEEVRIREAWSSAHQYLVQEIVNHQSSQSLLRITRQLNAPSDGNIAQPGVCSLSLTLCSAEAVDRIQTGAEESLRQEMEESVLTLSQKYEEVLAQYRSGDTSLLNSVSATMEEVLSEFASVMAQKALIDGHLALLQDEFDKGSMQTTQDSLIISEDNKDTMESVGDVLDSEAHLLMFLGGRDSSVESLIKPALSHAEFTYMFNKASSECHSDTNNLLTQLLSQKSEDVPELVTMLASSSSYKSSTRSLHQASPFASDRDQDILEQPQLRSAASMSKIQPSPKARRKSETRKSRRSSDITGMTSLGCRQCEELRQELNKLKKKLQLQNTVEEAKECSNCPKLLDTIEKLEESQRANVSRFESADSDDQLLELKQRLLLLEEGYESQITELKRHYEDALASHPDSCDEAIRQKYQTEIEHLRGLCEKGLGTMEGSQARIVAELKEKHRREIVSLQAEKDQALAEETQATLAALDAMRKAHEAEVQKEVAKLQVDFIRRMQGGQDIGQLTQQHEAEMQDIRREILSLSEKYSVKCLESADLEARIEHLNKQLGEATKTVFDLETRNSKLKTQLADKIETIKSGGSPGDTETELRIRTAEAAVKDDKLCKLSMQLQKAQTSPRKDCSSRGRRARNYADQKSSPAKN